MSSYEYTDVHSRTLSFTSSVVGKDRVLLGIESEHNEAFIHIPKTDAPTVALELLKAAGQESVIVPKAEGPVRASGIGGELIECGHGARKVTIHREDSAAKLRTKAANYIALAEYAESAAAWEAAEKAEAEAAERKLQERRDAVKAELVKALLNSTEPTDLTRVAIDRIIELATLLEGGTSRD